MEIFPAADEQNDAGSTTPAEPAPRLGPASPEPLSVESLEERVLLASDTAAGAPPPAEPAPYVAAPVAGGEPICDLASEAVEAETVSRDPAAQAAGKRDPSHSEAAEVTHEIVERSEPESDKGTERIADESGESDFGKSEFGLATIEPDKDKPLHSRDSSRKLTTGDTASSHSPERGETESVGEAPGLRPPAPGGPLCETSTLDIRVLDELGRERPAAELGASLDEETAIAPLLDELPAAKPSTVQSNLVDHQANVLAAPESSVANGPTTLADKGFQIAEIRPGHAEEHPALAETEHPNRLPRRGQARTAQRPTSPRRTTPSLLTEAESRR